MRKAFVWLSFVLTLGWSSVSVASAEERSMFSWSSPRQEEIFRQVAVVGGFLTEELHREYWSFVPEGIRNDPLEQAEHQDKMTRLVRSALDFQREAWLSIKMSARAGKVIYSAGYEIAKQQTTTEDDPKAIRDKAREGAAEYDQTIYAAAHKLPVHVRNSEIYLTPELADQMLIGIDASYARIERLLNPVWEPGQSDGLQ